MSSKLDSKDTNDFNKAISERMKSKDYKVERGFFEEHKKEIVIPPIVGYIIIKAILTYINSQ